jgi:hypothetical protein
MTQQSDPDVAALIQALTPVKVGRSGYTRLDRYRDFHRVFHGSPEGRRVLAQIVDYCEGPPLIEQDLSNHALLAARAHARKVGQMITAWASVPPATEA